MASSCQNMKIILFFLILYILAFPIKGTTDKCKCPLKTNWVCGADGLLYKNKCNAQCNGVQVAYFGKCRERDHLDLVQCINECSPEDNWVCGVDGVSYENACVARCSGVSLVKEERCARPRTRR